MFKFALHICTCDVYALWWWTPQQAHTAPGCTLCTPLGAVNNFVSRALCAPNLGSTLGQNYISHQMYPRLKLHIFNILKFENAKIYMFQFRTDFVLIFDIKSRDANVRHLWGQRILHLPQASIFHLQPADWVSRVVALTIHSGHVTMLLLSGPALA